MKRRIATAAPPLQPLPRSKAYVNATAPGSVAVYKFPGFQYRAVERYNDLDDTPLLQPLFAGVRALRFDGAPRTFNQGIITLYESGGARPSTSFAPRRRAAPAVRDTPLLPLRAHTPPPFPAAAAAQRTASAGTATRWSPSWSAASSST